MFKKHIKCIKIKIEILWLTLLNCSIRQPSETTQANFYFGFKYPDTQNQSNKICIIFSDKQNHLSQGKAYDM